MTITKNLLVELLVEELPPKTLIKLGESFAEGIFSGLEARDFLEPTSVKKAYSSPRRLAVHITGVRAVSKPRPQPPRTLMPVSVGLDPEGKPTAPLLKRLRSMYSDEADIERLMDERVFIEDEGGKKVLKHREGLAAGGQLFAGLGAALVDALEELPIAKVMTYQLKDGWSTVKFVRPAHGLVALHGADIVQIEILGLKAGSIPAHSGSRIMGVSGTPAGISWMVPDTRI